jgi:hypothetical protein
MERSEAIKILNSHECICGKDKSVRAAFCQSCYWILPLDIRRSLYSQIGFGFEQAYSNAKAWLMYEVLERQ